MFSSRDYGGFWMRVVAYVIDVAVLGLAWYGVWIVLFLLWGTSDYGDGSGYVDCFGEDCVVRLNWSYEGFGFVGAWGFTSWFLSGVVGLLYFSFFESSRLQATPGKIAMGLRVCDEYGRGLSFMRSLLRNVGKYVSTALLCIGFLMAAFTERKQCLHDKFVDAFVVRRV